MMNGVVHRDCDYKCILIGNRIEMNWDRLMQETVEDGLFREDDFKRFVTLNSSLAIETSS